MQAAVFDRVRATTHPLPTLDVPVHCMHGLMAGNSTEDHFLYDVDRFNASSPPAPTVTRMGKGDGTVNLKSLESCKRCVTLLLLVARRTLSHCAISVNAFVFPFVLIAGAHVLSSTANVLIFPLTGFG